MPKGVRETRVAEINASRAEDLFFHDCPSNCCRNLSKRKKTLQIAQVGPLRN